MVLSTKAAVGEDSERALAAGGSLRTALRLIAEVRPFVTAPIVVFSYANPLLRLGLAEFARQASQAGVDGVLALDLPIEEAGEFQATMGEAGLDTIFLLSPTTTDARIEKAAALGQGFLYGISRLGVSADGGPKRDVILLRSCGGIVANFAPLRHRITPPGTPRNSPRGGPCRSRPAGVHS